MRECCIHDTGTVLKIPFILDRNLAKANCAENQVCTSCNTVILASNPSPLPCIQNQVSFFLTGSRGGRGSGMLSCRGRRCWGSGGGCFKERAAGVCQEPFDPHVPRGPIGSSQQGPVGQRLVSCLLMGLPMVLHPVIFLRLLLHRLLSSMHSLTKWKSCASRTSWASQSETWKARTSSCDTETPTLSKRRKVNLTLDFPEEKTNEMGVTGTPPEKMVPSRSRKHSRIETRGSREDDARNGKGLPQSFYKSSKQRQNSFKFAQQSSSLQRNDTPTAASERVWKLRDTFASLSTKDVSDTISHFFPSVLRSSDSHQSMSSTSRSPTPPTNSVVSPPTQRTRTFRIKNMSKSAPENTSSDSTPVLAGSNDLDSCEEYINAFQKELQNLPSYERIDYIPSHHNTNLRPRSRSVPRVTYTSMSTLSIPVTRSPSLTPEIARGSEFVDAHYRPPSSHLTTAYSASHLTTPHTIAALDPRHVPRPP